MLTDFLTDDLVKLDVEASTPEEAIQTVGNLLVSAEKILPEYIDDMIQTFHNLGPYIVLSPGIAMPHSKPSNHVKEPCIAFCRLKKAIEFHHPTNDPVKFLFALAGNDEIGHLNLLKGLCSFLMNEENVKKLYTIQKEKELIELIRKEEGKQ